MDAKWLSVFLLLIEAFNLLCRASQSSSEARVTILSAKKQLAKLLINQVRRAGEDCAKVCSDILNIILPGKLNRSCFGVKRSMLYLICLVNVTICEISKCMGAPFQMYCNCELTKLNWAT